MADRKIFPAIAAGNVIILKPSKEIPLTALRLGQSILKLGFPSVFFNVVPVYGSED